MLQFDLQFYEELTVAWVRTVKFISGAFFWPTGQLVFTDVVLIYSGITQIVGYSTWSICAETSEVTFSAFNHRTV